MTRVGGGEDEIGERAGEQEIRGGRRMGGCEGGSTPAWTAGGVTVTLSDSLMTVVTSGTHNLDAVDTRACTRVRTRSRRTTCLDRVCDARWGDPGVKNQQTPESNWKRNNREESFNSCALNSGNM